MKTINEYREKLVEVEKKLKRLQTERHEADFINGGASDEVKRDLNCKINNALQTVILYKELIARIEPPQQKWIHLPVNPGSPECKAQLIEIPPGPYVHIAQHEESRFLEKYYVMSLNPQKEFSLRWGCATYAVGEDGKPLKVGYHYDTSD